MKAYAYLKAISSAMALGGNLGSFPNQTITAAGDLIPKLPMDAQD